ncbi:MAG TPA: tetratricopeptide repeat protein, partial [Vicinamibacterales bacterium]|nr:tetratricopeptide repeat protein [Vicinamibacterales bacterium]
PEQAAVVAPAPAAPNAPQAPPEGAPTPSTLPPSTPRTPVQPTAQKPTSAGTVPPQTAKPGTKPAPAAAGVAAVSRDAEAAQRLDVAKAKLSNNLHEQGLADLRQIMNDFQGSRAAAEAAFLTAEVLEKGGRLDDAMAAYVEFESRYGDDRRSADAKLRRAMILGRQRQPKAQALAYQLFGDIARDYPGSPQAAAALQNKVKIETDRRELRGIDPVTKLEVPAVMMTLRSMIEQFPDAPQSLAARNRLAMMYSQMNRHAEAAQVLEELAKFGDNPMDVWFRLGELYERRLNDPARAREAYAKVPPGSPRYNEAQRKLNRR